MKDLEEDQEMEFDKENVRPKMMAKVQDNSEVIRPWKARDEIGKGKKFKRENVPLTEIDVSSFKRPYLNSGTLFDPNLLAAFEQAVMEKCPQGGSDSIVLHTTRLRGIRKTFEDCQKVRALLENLRVLFFERDISMHREFKEELSENLGGKIVPTRLFVKGRYIGRADEVLGLHKQGKLKPLIEGIPIDRNEGAC
ncbi:hypothetical protein BUALT_Bualt19G0051500 [Buddleja alternifolia]|uniref:Glutaredoxin domain-containing protein n=1 Tax=Buddleja alternifolia TaxID=168488 RepID=A0AAV6W1G3_9LAMI|nr:hypothetical protein BUALT_Bualt19G0051500 [Buddleja alternifolia]